MPFTPRYTNLVNMLSSSVKAHGDRPAFGARTDNGWQWTSYEQFGALVDQCRSGLAALGIAEGDRVAVISRNRLQWAVAAHATYGLSAIYVPVHQTQLEQEWKYILQDSGARVCFVGDDGVQTRVRAIQADLYALEHIVNFEGRADDVNSFDHLMKRGAARPVSPRIPDDKIDIASFIYTAGISGNPKGVKLTHFNLASNASALIEADRIEQGEITVSVLPWAHVLGGAIELNTMMGTGSAIAICDNPPQLLQYLIEVKPTGLFAVPRLWNRIRSGIIESISSQPGYSRRIFNAGMQARSKQRQGQKLSMREKASLRLAEILIFPRIVENLGGRLKFASSGAAALPLETEEFFENLGIPIYQGYGLTECAGCATTNPILSRRLGSVGKPIPGVTVRIDKNVDEAAEGEGEVVVFGTGVMAGYHNLPGETLETVTKFGGVRTGDLGRIDEDGYLYITGSLKELYKLTNGRYVAPTPLEQKLLGSPYIARCMVYGANQAYNVALIVPDLSALLIWGEASGLSPFVHTLLKDPRTHRLFEEEIAKQSRNFKSFERIRNFALIRKEFSTSDGTLSPTLRLKRRVIAEKYRKTLQQLYAAS